ncbi:two-component system chemotaxis response regulator CheB [Mesorhizobium soli]|uniref:protein-glutamate methylesterase/protein-glutamine glutaminase n=1 Tax=Pseudaminobacter soli (ex Li et al. 2025) TaxID=1295366 RepID=UPI0024758CF2|nr:chemotaxis response regulator protein-glutamate methylesterase [Mesorhizobium soli]MDH6235249.1 two-component system chemotaxis response regulator CheB [Mesorhizobium soli]
MKSIRVLVVDDSATMRSLLSVALRRDPAIEVVGHAADALEARDKIKALNPDVLTLDVEMPNMNGLDFLDKIMRLRPMPVIMVSSLTSRHAAATLTALEIGAFDCISKASFSDEHAFEALIATVKAAARARIRPRGDAPASAAPAPAPSGYAPNGRVVAIGSSTGGVEALLSIVGQFPANCPPTVITQHMPPLFTKSFAERLNRLCRPTVSEAVDGAPLLPGHVYLAPGGASHLEVAGGAGALRCRLRAGEPVNGHRPSVDVLFASVAKSLGSHAVGVILTGMGRDGAAGLLALRQAGAATLGQDEATSLVYGMPRAAFEAGAVERQLPLDKIPAHLLGLTRAPSPARS